MASDASIYSMIRPPAQQQGPLEQYGAMMQLRSMGDASQLHALQRRKLEDDLAEEGAFKTSIADWVKAGGKGDIPVEAMAASPTRYGALKKQQMEGVKQAKEIEKLDVGMLADRTKQWRDALATVRGNEDLPMLADRAMTIWGPQVGPKMVPASVTSDWIQSQIATADKRFDQMQPKFQEVKIDTGGKIEIRTVDMNPVTNPGIKDLKIVEQKTLTPGEVQSGQIQRATLAETKRHHGVTEGHQQQQIDSDKFGPPVEVTGPDGKPRLALQNKRTGELVDANTRQPMQSVGPKVGETAQKQQIGVQNTVSALSEYRDALKNFAITDMASPNARAKMGTVYNNALLQAKEAFNLGVLNGPDYKILQEVLTDPTSLKGGITSKEALDAQAAKLEEIMGRVGKTITATQSGQGATVKPETPKPVVVTSLPDPGGQNKGKIARNQQTGEPEYRSDGTRWVRIGK